MDIIATTETTYGLLLFWAFPLIQLYRISQHERLKEEKFYDGSCHCGEVQFTVKAPRHLVAWDCNCSICYMKKNWHFIVPARNFHLTAGRHNNHSCTCHALIPLGLQAQISSLNIASIPRLQSMYSVRSVEYKLIILLGRIQMAWR